MKFKNNSALLLIILAFTILKSVISTFIKIPDIQNYSKKKILQHHSCIQFTQQIIYGQPAQIQRRFLQQTSLHGFKITPLYIQDFSVNATQNIKNNLLNILKIASKYFQVVLKVNQQPKSDTKYRGLTCAKVIVPKVYKNQGFNPNETDLLVFVTTSRDQNMNLAYSSTCQFILRPNYGRINFNLKLISDKKSQNYEFHRQILVTMHEITHILVLNTLYYLPDRVLSDFYYNPGNLTKRKTSQVIMKNPANNQTYMIITPSVQKYIKEYYNCSQNIGALLSYMNNTILENSSLKALPGSHWQELVFFDDFMMPTSYSSPSKINKVTLLFLKDSGFFDQVDTSMAQQTFFGKGKGCSFAKANIQKNMTTDFSDQYCNNLDNNSFSCDFYNTYGGQCFQNLIRGGGDGICKIPKQIPFNVYNSASRCIDVTQKQKNLFLCTQAKCLNGKIQIKINDEKVICQRGQKQVSSKKYILTIQCPKNFEVFCSVNYCQQWCDQEGVCVQGKCILYQCQKIFNQSCTECVKFNNGTAKCLQTGKIEQVIIKQQINVTKKENSLNVSSSKTVQSHVHQQNKTIIITKEPLAAKKEVETKADDNISKQYEFNCISWNQQRVCSQCIQGYGLDSKNVCIKCVDKNCKTCKVFSFYCIQCYNKKADYRGLCPV